MQCKLKCHPKLFFLRKELVLSSCLELSLTRLLLVSKSQSLHPRFPKYSQIVRVVCPSQSLSIVCGDHFKCKHLCTTSRKCSTTNSQNLSFCFFYLRILQENVFVCGVKLTFFQKLKAEAVATLKKQECEPQAGSDTVSHVSGISQMTAYLNKRHGYTE